jgi:CheY-like chemotaxis protein
MAKLKKPNLGHAKMHDWVQPVGGGRLVLVVDNDAQIRSYIKLVLAGADFQVLEAADGLNALEIFDVWRNKIDLVITDIRMPRMTGRELASPLRRRPSAVRPPMAYHDLWLNSDAAAYHRELVRECAGPMDRGANYSGD